MTSAPSASGSIPRFDSIENNKIYTFRVDSSNFSASALQEVTQRNATARHKTTVEDLIFCPNVQVSEYQSLESDDNIGVINTFMEALSREF